MSEPVRKLGPYELLTKIGQGAFGVVWLAEKRTAIATTKVALKLSRNDDIDIEAFRQEAAIWVQASGHPNVMPLIDADVYDDQVVIASEYVPDGSLANWLKQNGGKAPSIEAACEMAEGILAGLAHLHEQRIIHRDLKPDNILLQRGTPRLADFGIARLLRSGSYSANISGTLVYMAPEAFDRKRNERTDIWSVGVIMHEMLAGRIPYDQEDTPSLIAAIVRNDPPPLPVSVPAPLQRVVLKALKRNPAERYASAIDMRRDLREVKRMLWLEDHQNQEAGTLRVKELEEHPQPSQAKTIILPASGLDLSSPSLVTQSRIPGPPATNSSGINWRTGAEHSSSSGASAARRHIRAPLLLAAILIIIFGGVIAARLAVDHYRSARSSLNSESASPITSPSQEPETVSSRPTDANSKVVANSTPFVQVNQERKQSTNEIKPSPSSLAPNNVLVPTPTPLPRDNATNDRKSTLATSLPSPTSGRPTFSNGMKETQEKNREKSEELRSDRMENVKKKQEEIRKYLRCRDAARRTNPDPNNPEFKKVYDACMQKQ